MKYRPCIAVDFDGVIHSYESGWQGSDVIPDPPVPGAGEWLTQAAAVVDVAIFSSRGGYPDGRVAMAQYLVERCGVSKDLIRWAHLAPVPPALQLQLGLAGRWWDDEAAPIYLPVSKPPALVTIDDRAWRFEGEWPDLEELLAFKPWNKR